MLHTRNPLSGKGKYLLGSILLLATTLICAAFSMTGSDDFAVARREILLRRIGDQLLSQSGDHTSSVLPVKKIAENEYQISFEKQLAFVPDSLVNTTRRLLVNDPLAGDYIVNVLKCGNPDVTYGYALSKDIKNDIVPCKGRKQPRACYLINIKFKPSGINKVNNGYLLGSLSFLALVGFVFFRPVKPVKAAPVAHDTGMLTFGGVVFDVQHRKLIINGETIELTGTETRILKILALSPNEAIERSRLQKEIWEDEGIIVGRSLDMFISKLRKKLESDPHINLIVIRGKGYKLEVSA